MKLLYIVSIFIAVIVSTAAVFVMFQQNLFESYILNQDIVSDEEGPGPVGNLSFPDAVNAFAFDFFKELYSDAEGNVFISPYSIFTALAMTYEGAKGETADEMAAVLNVQQDNASFHAYMKNLYEVLNEQNEDYNISTANALWIRENLQLLETYLSVIQDFYGGDATEVNFSDPEEAAGIINQWVEDNTNGLIKDLILPEYIDPMLTALILTNAIYFKGIWEVQFDPANTTDRDFEITTGNTVQVQTMNLVETEDLFNYTDTDDVQILELPYTGDDLSMMIILPKNTTNVSTVINTVDADCFTEWKDALVETSLDIYLPKFKVETMYTVNDYLQQMGMALPFSSLADFSGITGLPNLFIDRVVHKAYIDVNEEGTEAAAATGVVVSFTSIHDEPPRIVVDCDHPFLYLIQHKDTGTILFMGIVSDPSP